MQKSNAVVVSAVSGMGGIGKTALAREVSGKAVVQEWFQGGIVFVDLHGYGAHDEQVRPVQLFAPLLQALGAPREEIPATAPEQAVAYHQLLARRAKSGQRVLIVLDNVSFGNQVRALLPRQMVHRALVTTRDAIDLQDAHKLDLDVMTSTEALALLSKSIANRLPADRRVSEGKPEALHLVSLCGSLPLAVSITASLLADEPSVTIQELSRISNRVAIFRFGEVAVAASFDQSWKHLQRRNPDAAALLPVLSLNPGLDIANITVAALVGKSVDEVIPLLRALRQASLLQHVGAGRWRMHDLIRQYASMQAERITLEADRLTASRRLLEFFRANAKIADSYLKQTLDLATLVEVADPSTNGIDCLDASLAWFDSERANLVEVARFATGSKMYELAFDLTTFSFCYMSWRRHLDDWSTLSELQLESAQRIGDEQLISQALLDRGQMLNAVGNLEDSLESFGSALLGFRAVSDVTREAVCLNSMGTSLRRLGRFRDAIDCHKESAQIFEAACDNARLAQAKSNLGSALRDNGKLEDSIRAYRDSMRYFRTVEAPRSKSIVLNNLALALALNGDTDEAIEVHREDIMICRGIGDRHGELMSLRNLADLLAKLDRLGERVSIIDRIISLTDPDLSNQDGAELYNLATALQDRGDTAMAIAAYGRAIRHFAKLGSGWREMVSWNRLGILYEQLGDLEDAKVAKGRAKALSVEFRNADRRQEIFGSLFPREVDLIKHLLE